MKYLGLAARVALGCVFLIAAWDKIADPLAFAKIMRNYQILPDALVGGAALLLPWVEVVVGASLITGFLPRGASLTACLLMLIFIGAISLAYARGLNTQCGCFTTKADDAISAATFLRDGMFLVLALLAVADGFRRPCGT